MKYSFVSPVIGMTPNPCRTSNGNCKMRSYRCHHYCGNYILWKRIHESEVEKKHRMEREEAAYKGQKAVLSQRHDKTYKTGLYRPR